MTSKQESKETLRKLVKKRSVFDLDALFDALGTRSRMTVFRRLQQVGYLSSFTHGGRFYTLENIPQFDEFGLWFHRDIGFSQAGTLKETVVLQVEKTPEGRTHEELQHLLRVRAHNTLLKLLRQGRIGQSNKFEIWSEPSWNERRQQWIDGDGEDEGDLPADLESLSL